MWRCNILGDNEGSISYILRFDHIAAGSILLTANLVALKRENYEPILIVKRTEWRKLIYYSGLSIESDLSKVVKKYVFFVRIGSISSTSSGNHHISRKHIEKQFNLEPKKLRMNQLPKNIASIIAPHIYSTLRDLGVIFDKYILSSSLILACEYCAGTSDSCYGTKNEQENTQNNVIEGDTKRYMTVDTD